LPKIVNNMKISVKRDDASSAEVIELLESHLVAMQAQTPPESVHALDLSAYQSPNLTLWTVWTGDNLMGCGALQDHGLQQGVHLGEIKSMRTKSEYVRMGVAKAALTTILDHAKSCGMHRVSLETGVTEHFQAAQYFYERNGFTKTTPFANYTDDPHSVYYTLNLSSSANS